jgi:hypothetical protein
MLTAIRRSALVALLALATTGVGAQAAAPPAPCAACVGLALDGASAGTLVQSEAPVRDLDVLLTPDGWKLAPALTDRGARVWLEVAAAADWAPPPAFPDATGLVLRLPEGDSPPGGDSPPPVFLVQRTATMARAARPHVRLVLRIAGDAWSDEDARAVAPYVDAVLLAGPSGPVDVRTASARFGGLDVWAWSDRREALAGTLEGEAALRIMVPEHPAAAARALHALRDWMPPGLTPLAGVEATCDGCRSATWLHPETLQGIAVVEGVTPGATLRIAPDAVRVAYVDPARGAAPAALEVERSVGAARVRLPDDTGRQLVLAIAGWRGTEDEVYRTAVEVTAARTLTVEEIVARHQAQRARQATLVQTVIAVGHTVLTFEVPGFPGPVTVTADTTIFTRGALTEVAQSSVRVNGMDLMTDGHAPRVPIIDAERVSTPPLTIALTPLYAYELAGRERQGGRDAYVVAFRSTRQGPAFRGRAWIDAATFALLRMEAAQVALSGPIVSSEQHDEYVPVRVGDREAWLVGRSGSFQVYQAAGLRTPIHREIVTPTHLVNVAEFDTRLDEAHASRAVMLRDTPEGYRYLVPGRGSEAAARRVVADDAGRRVVSAVFGVLVDPNITVPLPYAGISYLDFDLLDRDIQFSAFFGGAYGQLAWTIPRFVRPGWQLTGRAFGIAASYNDRSFREGLERYDENIQQRPFRSSVALIAPLSPRLQARVGYEFEYTAFREGDDTGEAFVVPRDAVVHGLRVGLDLQRGPWSARAWWNPARRQGWALWGRPGLDHGAGTEDFQKYGAGLARSWVFRPGVVARVEANWMGGRDLDRFSRYTFDSFENRLRGYPSASLRYDRGAVVRSAATWTPVERLRLDVFADYAAVRDPGFGHDLRHYPGFGAAAEVPLPRRLLVAVEWGYGVNARNTDGSAGTHVVRVSGVKVF